MSHDATHRQMLIEGVKAHALRHYDEGAWDLVIETMDDAEIDARIGRRTKTVLGAVQMMAIYLRPIAGRRQEVLAEIF